MPVQDKPRHINDLIHIMDALLAPNGCPWDREQTTQSLAPFAIEEAHELAEAIEGGNSEEIKEELGDLLMQVIFHSALTKNRGEFTLEDVIEGICTKLIRRHPHVFGDVKVKDSDEVLKNWSAIKNQEKSATGKIQKGLGIPLSLPALQRAQKIGDKTKTLKFDWENAPQVLEKVEEELRELKTAMKNNDRQNIEEEIGDLFFSLAQLTRHLKFEAETVARAANRKFEKRFEKLLSLAKDRKLDFQSLPNEEKEKLWEEVKKV
jgi:tetrapyrrole methylase family protein/MazG family protein